MHESGDAIAESLGDLIGIGTGGVDRDEGVAASGELLDGLSVQLSLLRAGVHTYVEAVVCSSSSDSLPCDGWFCREDHGEIRRVGFRSGGPVFKKVNDRWELVALVSRGGAEECGTTPDAHTCLAYYRPWVDAVVDGMVATDLPLTDAQAGPIPHPSIRFTTTEKMQLPDRIRQFAA